MFRRDGKALEGVENDLRDLRRELLDLADGFRALQGRMESVDADSMLQWEKVNRALGRLAKRAEANATEPNGPDRGACKSMEEINEIIRAGGDPWPTRS